MSQERNPSLTSTRSQPSWYSPPRVHNNQRSRNSRGNDRNQRFWGLHSSNNRNSYRGCVRKSNNNNNHSQRENYNNSYERHNYKYQRHDFPKYKIQRYERCNDSWRSEDSRNISFNDRNTYRTYRETPKSIWESQKETRSRKSPSKTYRKASQKETHSKTSSSKTYRKECRKKTFTKENQKKAQLESSNKEKKSRKQNSPISNNLSFFVDPLPSEVENKNIYKDSNYSDYVLKSNLEFPDLESPEVPSNPLNKSCNLRKRRLSQSSIPSEVFQGSRKRHMSGGYSSSQPVSNHKNFREESSGDDSFEKILKCKNKIDSTPPPQFESIKEKDKISSLPEPLLECKVKLKKIENKNIGSNPCNNDELEPTQSQICSPFSIPCGQVQKKEIDELDRPTQEDHISLANFFSQTSSSQASLTFEEDIKSKKLHSSQDDKNNITSHFSNIDEPVQSQIPNDFSILGNLEESAFNYYDSLFSTPPTKDKIKKIKSPAGDESNLCDEPEFILSSQECESLSSVLPNIESLKNLSRSMSENKLVSATFQDSKDASVLAKESSTESCEEPATSKKESENSFSFINPCTPHPLTSTQYGPKRRNLYTPLISPLKSHEQDCVTSDSLIDLQVHPDDSVVICSNKNQVENTDKDCVTLSTQPFQNLSTNERSPKIEFKTLKIKMEELFDVEECNDEQSSDTVETSENVINENSERLVVNVVKETVCNEGLKLVVPASESGIERPEISDCENSVNTIFDNSMDRNERVLMQGSEAKNNKVNKENVHYTTNNNVICEGEKSSNDNPPNITVPYEDFDEKDLESEDEPKVKKKNFIESEEKLDKKLSVFKKMICEEYDAKVSNVLSMLKKLFEKKKEDYLNKHISTSFNIRLKTIEGSDLHKEKKSFTLPNINTSSHGESQIPKNIVDILIKTSNDVKFSPLNGENNFIDYNGQTYPSDGHNKNTDIKDRVTKTIKKNGIIDPKNNKTNQKKHKSKKLENISIVVNNNWWENIVKEISDSIFDSSTKNTDHCSEHENEGLNNLDNASDYESNLHTEDAVSESANTQGIIITKKKKKRKKTKSEEFIQDENEEEMSPNNEIKIELTEPSRDYQTPKERVKISSGGQQQHVILLNELSRSDEPALSNVKKTLKKKLKRNIRSQKTLTPPFEFKKSKTNPGKKRTLLSSLKREYQDLDSC